MSRVLKVLAAAVALIPIVVLGLVFTVLRTEVGAGWVLGIVEGRVPGLSYQESKGSLAGGLDFVALTYRQDGMTVGADQLHLAVSPEMFPWAIRVHVVEIDDLEVRLPPSNEDDAPAGLPPSLALPLEVVLERGIVNGLRILDSDDGELVSAKRLELRARAHQDVTIEHAELVLANGRVLAHGEVGLENPFRARLETDIDYELALEDVAAPLRLTATGLLEGGVGAYELTMDGSAELQSFVMTAMGSVDLGTTEVSGQVSWRNFSWPPGGDGGDSFRSESGRAEVSGTLDDWRFDGQAGVEAPGVAAGELRFEATGDRNHVEAEIPRAEVLGGKLSGTVFYDWAAGGEYRARLVTDRLSTHSLYPDWPAVVSGGIDVSGRVEPLVVAFEARDMEVLVEGQTITANGSGMYGEGELVFSGLTLRAGESRLALDGSLDRPEGVLFEADIADLGRFVPGAAGSLNGQGRFAMRENVPRLDADLVATGLAWDDLAAERLRLTSVSRKGPGGLADLRIESEQTRLGSNSVELLTVELGLGHERQDLELRAMKDGYELSAGMQGAIRNLSAEWADWRWEGQLMHFSLAGEPEGLIELEEPTDLVLTRTEVGLNAACLAVTSRARACLDGGWAEATGARGKAVFDRIPLRLLDPYLEAVELSQAVDGEVQFEIPPGAEASATARFTFAPGSVRYSGEDVPILETGEGLLAIQLKEGEITRGRFSLPIVDQGEVDVEFEVGDISEGLEAEVTGNINANMNDLDVLSVFLPLADEIGGRLRANLALSGTLERPYFRGRIDLSNGLLRHTASGLVLSDIQLNGQISGDGKADLTGSFEAVEGEGRLAATLDLLNPVGPEMELSVYGEELKIFDAEDLVMTVDPDLQLGWRDGALHLGGRIVVLEALIAPSIIPSAPVGESQDVQVVAGSLPRVEATSGKRQKIPVNGTLEVVLGRGVAVDLSVAELEVTGKSAFEWKGPLMPVARGEFELEGEILAFGQRLEITEGNIGFPGVPADNPHLNIQAERPIYGNSEIRRAGLLVTGTLRRMVIEPYTDPMTTRERAQTLLVTGSDFNMERGVGAVSVGTYIAPKIFLSYGVGVFGTENVVSVRYDLGGGWGVIATSGDNQTGVDIGYTIEN